MPRTDIDIEPLVESLSILDEDGEVDEELVPELDDETLEELLRVMIRTRRFDERLLELQRQGRIGTFAPVQGQEAAQLGAVAALKESDWLVPSFRETAAAIWRGASLVSILLYNAGYNEGGAIEEGARDFPILIPVGTQLPIAAGLAWAAKASEDDDVVLAFFGDGATSEGDFHEAANFAGVFDLPMVFVCQNNQWAISVPRDRQSRSTTLAQKAIAYGFPGIQVDGNDVLAVYAAAREAVERARSGEGPTLVECVTYRLSVHTTADDPSKYRSEDEVEKWEDRDPLPRLKRYLAERGSIGEDDVDGMEKNAEDEIRRAWEEAEEKLDQLGDPLDMFDHVWAEMPATLEAQKQDLRRHLDAGEGD